MITASSYEYTNSTLITTDIITQSLHQLHKTLENST